jgi:endonuclease/exonuclease/phosphatase family metal-dependent hydrolase
MTYNIHAAAHDGKVHTQKIANFILEQNVDLVALNEVARFMPKSDGRDNIGELAKETGMAYVFSNNNTALTGNDQFGNAILSKYPILFKDHRLLPNVGDNEQRGWLKAVVDMNGKFLSFWVSHLDFKNSDTERLKCGTNFNAWIADEIFPVVFGGDFNDTPGGAIHALMEKKWTDIWEIAGDGTLGRTVPCPGPTAARIDYIWKATASSSLAPTNAFVGLSLEASDHFSVLSQFVLTNFTNHATGFYFPFDEGSGTKVTDIVGKLTGTLGAGAPTWSSDGPTGQAGDSSLFFNGTKKITVTDTNQIIGTNGLNDSYTLQAWIKVAVNYAPPQRAILFQYDRKPGFSFSINTNRTLHTTTFKIKDIASTAALPNDGQWHHIAVIHTDGANMKFYIDGALVATVAYSSGAGYRTDADITIGSADDGANPFTGNLARIKFDQRALTPAELDFPAVPPLGIRTSGTLLTLFWPAAMTNYTLQVNGALQTNGWVNVAGQIQNGEIQANIAPTNSAKFFRLKRQ